MQRQRPRLKQFLVRCDLPGCTNTAVKLYPTRPSARSRIRHTYCCVAHGKRHWAQLHRQQVAASAGPYQCAGPDCAVMIEPSFSPGRKKLYHDDACRERARTARRQRAPAGDLQRATARVLKAHRHLRDAVQAQADHRAAFDEWLATAAAAADRQLQVALERRTAKGKQGPPRWKPWFQDLLDHRAATERAFLEWDEELAEDVEDAESAVTAAVTAMRLIEERLARRAAAQRQRRAQGKEELVEVVHAAPFEPVQSMEEREDVQQPMQASSEPESTPEDLEAKRRR